MSDQLHIGKGFLKEKFGEYQVNPPESVWNSVSATLGKKSKRGLYIILLATAASVALAITLGISYFGKELPDRLGENEKIIESQKMPELPEQSGTVFPSQSNALPDVAITKRGGNLEKKIPEAIALIASEKELSDQKEVVAGDRRYSNEEGEAWQDLDLIKEEVARNNFSEVETPEIDPPADTTVLLTLDAGGDLSLDQVPEIETKAKRDPRWMLGAVLSPLYSYRDADLEAMSGGSEYESGLVSYAGGINVSYRGNSRLAIETGIHFNKMGIAIGAPGIQLFENSYEFAPNREVSNGPELMAITNSVGNIVTESGQVVVNGYKLNAQYGADAISNSVDAEFTQVAEQGIEQHLDYIEVPFNVRYTVVDRTFELQLVGGMSTNFLVNNYVTMETPSGMTDIGYLTNLRSVNYSGNAGIGMIYHLRDRFSLLLEPRFRYFLNSVNDATLPSTRPYALGIYTGISFTF